MTDEHKTSAPQVISSVHSRGYGRTRLVLQSVCGANGRRYLRAVWEYQGDDKNWHTKDTAPEFNATVWSDVIAKAAQAGMLSSKDYKGLLVRLAQGLDSSKSPTPKAFVRFTGILTLEFPRALVEDKPVDEVAVYEALNGPSRNLTVTQAQDPEDGTYRLDYVVEEDIHYMEALARLPEAMRELASKTSLEEAIAENIEMAFCGIFGEPGLEAAGFDKRTEADFSLTVL